jgi:hypothetical protein
MRASPEEACHTGCGEMKFEILRAGLFILAMGAATARPQEAARLKLAAAAWHTVARRNHGFESL